MDNILELELVSKTFPKSNYTLDKVSFSIPYGAIMGFVGENGAGKTTTIGCILNTVAKDSGTIKLFGKEMSDDDTDIREKIGVVYDGENFPGYLNAEELAKIMQGLYKNWDNELFQKYLRDFNLSAKQKIKSYSRGMTMKLAISVALSHHPQLLILDEATAMLDPRGREQVMQTIHYLNRNMGITVVSITHYMEEAAQADRVLVMSKGHVVMEGTPKEVFSQTERVRSLHLDVPQAAELRDELVKAGIPMPEGIIDTGECAQALYELLQ